MNYKPTLLLAISMLLDVYYVRYSVGVWVGGGGSQGTDGDCEASSPSRGDEF